MLTQLPLERARLLHLHLTRLAQKASEFQILVDGQSVGLDRTAATALKPIVKGGDGIWKLEPVEPYGEGLKGLVCLMKCNGIPVGAREGRVYGFTDENDSNAGAKWIVSAGPEVDGEVKMNIALLDGAGAWSVPGDDKQIILIVNIVPMYDFILLPLPLAA